MTELPRAADVPFDEWATARLARLLRFAFLVTGAQVEAEDAVQTALTQACARWDRVRATDDPDTYVRRMVVNAHISTWRRHGRRELSVAEVRDEPAGDPAVVVTRDDLVWQVCAGLPPQQRAAVVLRFYEDLDYAEVARVLEVTEATARSHVHRGLAALRRRLAEEGEA